jgi:hypothetical protein
MNMSKGKMVPEPGPRGKYHKDLDHSSLKFLNAMATYHSGPMEERERLQGVMDQQLAIIRASSTELRRAGIHKQDVKVENNYKAYIQDPSLSNYAALKHDVETLRLYNELP